MCPGGKRFGRRGTHGSPALCHQNAAEGEMRGHNELNPVHRVRSPLAPVYPHGTGAGAPTGVALRRGGSFAGEYSRAALVPPRHRAEG